MRRVYLLAAMLGCLLVITGVAYSQTVSVITRQSSTTTTDVTGVLCTDAAPDRWTGWVQVNTQRCAIFDVDFVDANSSAASLNTRCESSTSNATVDDAGRDMPTITSTSAAGVSTIMQGSWSWVSTAGAAPGSSSYTLQVCNVPAPFVNCLFTCGAGGAAADTITVAVRTVTP